MWVWKSIFSQFEKTTSDVNKTKNISHIFPKFGQVMSKKKKNADQGGICRNFLILIKKCRLFGNNRASYKLLYIILHYLIRNTQLSVNQFISTNFKLNTQIT